MTARDAPTLLFSFGTLVDEPVQQAVFGAPVASRRAALAGHDVVDVAITDPHVIEVSGSAVHRGLRRRTGAAVTGGVLQLSPEQLAQADAYEVDAYVRRRVRLQNGDPAWAYVAANPLEAAERIAVIGDSIAHGRTDPAGGWAAALGRHHVEADEANHRLFQLAIPGATLVETCHRAPGEVDRRRADTVLVHAGINDLAGTDATRRSPGDLVEAMGALCTHIEDRGARPVVLGPIWTDEQRAAEGFGLNLEPGVLQRYRDELLRFGETTGRDVVDLWPVLEDRPDLISDGVHPTPEGHAALFAALPGINPSEA
ncbi:GDSL-type esterase/lipase family protein [Kocuria sp.]|uniref:GDSL-type esterase/lipase family protein n=1 Tax=Kocuria sp. TaxID=1871328 RepID=UPI0026DBD709|nr:GDSL-type esterase/lipase family protein [Kocuria sp.]MDO4918141.1 GDSL-type esterase/lipase family protein [Kocuria sp.]